MWITFHKICGKHRDKLVVYPLFQQLTKECDSFQQFIHKVIRNFSTFLYARPFAFIHLSTYTTTATI